MTDLSQLSNDELLKMYQQPDPRGLVTDAARKYGIPEDMLHRLADQESRYNPRAVSPAGAKGIMQLMDPTAAELGVTDPFDPVQNVDAGARYLRQQYDEFGDWKLAAAAYNAGPGRVKSAGGVPNIPETVNYVSKVVGDGGQGSDLANMSNDQLLAMYGQPETAADQAEGWEEVGASHNRGVTVELPTRAADEPKPELVADDALGFLTGFIKPMETLNSIPNPVQLLADKIGLPDGGQQEMLTRSKSAIDRYFDKQKAAGKRPGALGEFAGNLTGTAWVPGGPITAGAISGALLSDHDDAGGVLADAALGAAGGKLGDKAIRGVSKAIGSVFGRAPKVMGASELKSAKTAAYAAVDNEGVRYSKGSFRDLISGIKDELGDIDADVNTKAAAVLRNIEKRDGQEPTLTDLDNMRQFVRLNIGGAGADDAEKRYAAKIIGNIDEFIGAKFPRTVAGSGEKGAQAIKAARDLNARLKKVEAVQDAVAEAEIRAGKTGTGGNFENALRQELDKVRKTQPGLKPDEKVALEAFIKGTRTQNTLRTLGRLSPTTGGLSAMLSTGAAGATGGASVPVSVAGFAAKSLADVQTQRKVDRLIKLFAAGGKQQDVQKVVPPAARQTQRLVEKARGVGSKASAVGAVTLAQ